LSISSGNASLKPVEHLLSGYRPDARATSSDPGGSHREERIDCPPGGCTRPAPSRATDRIKAMQVSAIVELNALFRRQLISGITRGFFKIEFSAGRKNLDGRSTNVAGEKKRVPEGTRGLVEMLLAS